MPAPYGLLSTGYNLKRLDEFQADLEADVLATFPGANITPQSVFGQLIGIFAAALAEREEQNLALYDSFRLSTAEGVALDERATLLGQTRNTDELDSELRARLLSFSLQNSTPQNATANLCRTLTSISGVTYVAVNVDEANTSYEVVVDGGDEEAIAAAIYAYHPTGITITGTEEFDISTGCGFCQRIRFTRPTQVDVCIRLVIDPLPEPCSCDVSSVSPFVDAVFQSLTDGGQQCTGALGASLFKEQFYASLLSVGSVQIVSAEFSKDGGASYVPDSLVLNSNEYASFSRSCVDVSFAP